MTKTGFSPPSDLIPVATVEGAPVEGTMMLRKLLHGQQGLLIEIHLTKSTTVPTHQHDDHECFCFLLRGKLRLHIADTERTVSSRDFWMHPQSVAHSTHALEDSVWLEFKTSPAAPFTFIEQGDGD
jgi:quercetin dioxygenase-like cupin family protein